MSLLKIVAVVALFLAAAAVLKANGTVNLYAPLADVATGCADVMLRVASWARGQA